jgi:hypothetical protein
VEYFAGIASWTKELNSKGIKTVAYEILTNPKHDLLSDEGLLNALALVLRTKAMGVHHWATVCSSWVCINRHTSGRSMANPLGHKEPCAFWLVSMPCAEHLDFKYFGIPQGTSGYPLVHWGPGICPGVPRGTPGSPGYAPRNFVLSGMPYPATRIPHGEK